MLINAKLGRKVLDAFSNGTLRHDQEVFLDKDEAGLSGCIAGATLLAAGYEPTDWEPVEDGDDNVRSFEYNEYWVGPENETHRANETDRVAADLLGGDRETLNQIFFNMDNVEAMALFTELVEDAEASVSVRD